MGQPDVHWFLYQKILLFHSLQIWIAKTMSVNSDVSYWVTDTFLDSMFIISLQNNVFIPSGLSPKRPKSRKEL